MPHRSDEFDPDGATSDGSSPVSSRPSPDDSAAETTGERPDPERVFASARGHADPPETIGHYRIEDVIGQGGMGAVYRARQSNPDREVALKVIRAGYSSRSLLKRFELEAQLLGRLQHSGIAQIHEAGTFETPRGPQPFFAMELVRGDPLDRYARTNRLDLRARLELVAKIADAVHHAHMNGIVHRDLKPGNIFVTGDGQPKVLDFGVARATDSDVKTTTIQTDVGQLVGTVPYMSPEQVTGDPGEIDARSDVYALGVVLYELLAGRLPYELDRKMIHEAARMIREDDPTPLSSLDRTLRGDVDTIVAKALEKEKPRRYQSAADMAADIRRHLADEPIAARPPSTLYQLAKFARRNRALVVGVLAVFVVLVAGVIVSTALAVRATAAELSARASLAEAEATVDFLDDMLAAVDPGAMGKDVTVRAVLDEASRELAREFADRPLVAARLHSTVGRTYIALGVVDDGAAHVEAAHAIRIEQLGEDSPQTLRSAAEVADATFSTGRVEEGERMLLEAIDRLTAALGREHPHTIYTITRLAGQYAEHSEYEKALTTLREAVRLNTAAFGAAHADTLGAQSALAQVLTDLNRLDEAEAIYDQTLATAVAAYGLDHPTTLPIRGNIGWFQYMNQRFEEAVATNEPLLDDVIRVFGEEHQNTGNVMNNLALAYKMVGRLDESLALQRRQLAISERTLGERHPSTLISMTNLGSFLSTNGPLDEALELLERSVELHREVLGSDNPGTGYTLRFYATVLKRLDRLDEAEAAYLECYGIFERAIGPDVPIVRQIAGDIADLYESRGNPEQAAAWRAKGPIEAPNQQ